MSEIDSDHHSGPTHHRGLDYPLGNRVPAPGELIEIAPGVHWARLPMPGSLDHINVWAVEDGDGMAIVDTGLPVDSAKAAWRAIFDGPLAGRTITRVIATHLHPDHIGLAGWLCRKFDVRLWMTQGEYLTARMLIADVRERPPELAIALRRGAGWAEAQIEAEAAKGWGWFARAVHRMPDDYVRVRAGDRLGPWRVVIGSGHSPEHMCLVDEGRRLIISGDQVLPRISSNVSLSSLEPDGDPLGDWLESLGRFRAELPADLLVLPAHGAPFTGLHARLDALIQGHHKQLDRLEQRLGEAPRRAIDCFGVMFARQIDDRLLGMATGETLAHLRYLELNGKAVREDREGVWWWRAEQ